MMATAETYKKDVDFASLAVQFPDFARKLKTNRQLDFSDPESVRQLTKTLLQRDFQLKIDLPDDRLCPPIPNRFNYILFVQNLLDSSASDYRSTYDPEREVTGLDIGTGASAIYPLLACRQRPLWRFLATEIDQKSYEHASSNVHQNQLEDRIKVMKVSPEVSIIPSYHAWHGIHIDILVTNPPFYSSNAELVELAQKKSRPPNSACTGAPVEMVYPGGEVAFVQNIMRESKNVHENHGQLSIQWCSSMVGRLSSIPPLVDKLRELDCSNHAITEFTQGQKTKRWCIAWSWSSLRPSSAVARGTSAVENRYLPFPTELEITIFRTPELVLQALKKSMSGIEGMDWKWREDMPEGVGRSLTGDVWSRHARRKRKKQEIVGMEEEEDNHEQTIFAVKVFVQPASTPEISTLHIRWLQGYYATVFESFCGWVKRKMS